MGDRSNVVMQYGSKRAKNAPKEIFFYSHWDGAEVASKLHAALTVASKGQSRLDDDAYLSRIVFAHLIADSKGKVDITETSGHGVSPFVCDNSYPFLVVDIDRQEVRLEKAPDDEEEDPDPRERRVLRKWTIEQYLKADPEKLCGIMGAGGEDPEE